jgi:hypothetical protein
VIEIWKSNTASKTPSIQDHPSPQKEYSTATIKTSSLENSK